MPLLGARGGGVKAAVAAPGVVVERFGIYEATVPGGSGYSNPFDFNVIELVISITGAETKTIRGFHDGGTTWKWRFMPSVVGAYTFTGSWSGSSAAGAPAVPSGVFSCGDTGVYRGQLSADPANTWYFRDARNAPFHMRGYGMHRAALATPGTFVADVPRLKGIVDADMVPNNFNFTLISGPFNRDGTDDTYDDSWWEGAGSNTRRFAPAVWAAFEDYLDHMKELGIYAITFSALFHQTQLTGYTTTDMQVIQHYFIARLGAFYNFLGWSPIWEWEDLWTTTTVNTIMNYFQNNDPYGRPLTIHDSADDDFTWLDFVERQIITSTLAAGNSRQASGVSRVESTHVNRPIIGAEDIWEGYTQTTPDHATTLAGVVRACWGEVLAGVMPLYSEWNGLPPTGLQGTGVSVQQVRMMYDFLYTYTRYREYTKTVTGSPPVSIFNTLVTAPTGNKAAAGLTGQEYLIYVENSGTVTVDLSDPLAVGKVFSVRWFDPLAASMTTVPAANVTASASTDIAASPYLGDSVLLLVLTAGAPTVTAPLEDKSATVGVAFSYTFDPGSFTDPNPGDVLTYTATLSSGAALPGWLTFTPGTRTFSGTPAVGDIALITVRVTATDPGALAVFDDFTINTTAGGTVPGAMPTFLVSAAHQEGTTLASTFASIPVPVHSSGNLLLLQVLSRTDDNNGGATVNTAGWTAFPGNPYGGTNAARQSWFWKIGDGVETVVSVTGAGGALNDLFMAVVHAYSAANGFHASPIEAITSLAGTDAQPTGPTITTLGNNRRAVCGVCTSGNNTSLPAFTGMSGGTWTMNNEDNTTSGGDGTIQVQSAPLASAGTISGGAMGTITGTNWTVVGFALRPAEI